MPRYPARWLVILSVLYSVAGHGVIISFLLLVPVVKGGVYTGSYDIFVVDIRGGVEGGGPGSLSTGQESAVPAGPRKGVDGGRAGQGTETGKPRRAPIAPPAPPEAKKKRPEQQVAAVKTESLSNAPAETEKPPAIEEAPVAKKPPVPAAAKAPVKAPEAQRPPAAEKAPVAKKPPVPAVAKVPVKAPEAQRSPAAEKAPVAKKPPVPAAAKAPVKAPEAQRPPAAEKAAPVAKEPAKPPEPPAVKAEVKAPEAPAVSEPIKSIIKTPAAKPQEKITVASAKPVDAAPAVPAPAAAPSPKTIQKPAGPARENVVVLPPDGGEDVKKKAQATPPQAEVSGPVKSQPPLKMKIQTPAPVLPDGGQAQGPRERTGEAGAVSPPLPSAQDASPVRAKEDKGKRDDWLRGVLAGAGTGPSGDMPEYMKEAFAGEGDGGDAADASALTPIKEEAFLPLAAVVAMNEDVFLSEHAGEYASLPRYIEGAYGDEGMFELLPEAMETPVAETAASPVSEPVSGPSQAGPAPAPRPLGIEEFSEWAAYGLLEDIDDELSELEEFLLVPSVVESLYDEDTESMLALLEREFPAPEKPGVTGMEIEVDRGGGETPGFRIYDGSVAGGSNIVKEILTPGDNTMPSASSYSSMLEGHGRTGTPPPASAAAAPNIIKETGWGIRAPYLLPPDIEIRVATVEKEQPGVSFEFSKGTHPMAKGKRQETAGAGFTEETGQIDAGGEIRQERIFYVERAVVARYTFTVKNIGPGPARMDVSFRLFSGRKEERVKAFKDVEVGPGGTVRYLFLLPEAVFWDDEDYFTGSVEGPRAVTKFNDSTGLVWKEKTHK